MDEERAKPKQEQQPKRPIVSNPSTPGIQTPNRPDGRDDSQSGFEKRG
jgi:hypothetical protein